MQLKNFKWNDHDLSIWFHTITVKGRHLSQIIYIVQSTLNSFELLNILLSKTTTNGNMTSVIVSSISLSERIVKLPFIEFILLKYCNILIHDKYHESPTGFNYIYLFEFNDALRISRCGLSLSIPIINLHLWASSSRSI